MTWKSKAQARWGHSSVGLKALGGKKKVAEWDRMSEGMKLPKKKKK